MSYIGYSHAANHIAPPHVRETLTPDGSATYFDLSNDVVGYHEENVIVVVNNVIQEPYASYTIINDASNRPRRLDFAGVALASTDSLYVIHQGIGTMYNTPAAGSVTKTSLASNLVSHTVDKFAGSDATSGSTILALSETPTNADAISVYVNGVYQRAGAGGSNNYSVTGSNLTFTSALASTDQIDVHHHSFRPTITKVADNSVGDAQLASGTLTTSGVSVDGTLTATRKSFLIPHPTDEDKQLQYASLEGPENGVYIRGKLKGDNIIELPHYWTELIDKDSISVSLTPIGNFQYLYVRDISTKQIMVGINDKPTRRIYCHYVVYAERKDIDKLEVEI